MQNISFDQFIIPSPSPTIETAIKGLIIIAKIISTNLIAEIIPKNTRNNKTNRNNTKIYI